MFFSLLSLVYPPNLMSGEMLSYPGGWDKPILEVNYLWLWGTSTPNNLEKACLMCVLCIFCTFVDNNEKNNHYIEGGTRESHSRVRDLQHPGLGMPSCWLQILDTRMRFLRLSLNVVIDNKIYHDFVQGQGYPPECQRFVVHDEACRVVDVANLWQEGGFPRPCTKSWLIIFLLRLSIPITRPNFCCQKLLQNGAKLG